MKNKTPADMDEQIVRINPTVFLKVQQKEPDQVIFVDNLVISPFIKDKLLKPYLTSLF